MQHHKGHIRGIQRFQEQWEAIVKLGVTIEYLCWKDYFILWRTNWKKQVMEAERSYLATLMIQARDW